MAQTIELAFSVGDVVWFVNRTTYHAASTEILATQVNVTNTTEIKYKLSDQDWRLEADVFASQEDLAASFEPL